MPGLDQYALPGILLALIGIACVVWAWRVPGHGGGGAS
jgi:hypothetical protein